VVGSEWNLEETSCSLEEGAIDLIDCGEMEGEPSPSATLSGLSRNIKNETSLPAREAGESTL